MPRELLIVVLFCGVIFVVCYAQFVCDNYLRVRLHVVQGVSFIFANKYFLNLSRELKKKCSVWTDSCCRRRVLCAIHCDNNLLVRFQFVQRVSSFSRINVSCNVSRELLIVVLFDCFVVCVVVV